ncbi:MAG: DUF4242 domain-containing protein [Gammaproteobacteria bacterium]|nr:MAG: DUF4242 domain-containing protein [Gammaproteobacteria bacterium]UCH38700.1 MAG: DUF4242 domain-containing protein [Gammaproteobacteria bacterium]
MTDMILERYFDPALTPGEVVEMAAESADCFGIHRVDWEASYLSADGHKLVCNFRAPDMESARIALRETDTDPRVMWKSSVHDAPGIEAAEIDKANVLVERSFDDAVALQQIQDIEDAGIWCLEIRDVRFLRTFFSADRKRMLCLYAAPDAESVRQAQREAGVPFDEAWAFSRYGPEDLSRITS